MADPNTTPLPGITPHVDPATVNPDPLLSVPPEVTFPTEVPTEPPLPDEEEKTKLPNQVEHVLDASTKDGRFKGSPGMEVVPPSKSKKNQERVY